MPVKVASFSQGRFTIGWLQSFPFTSHFSYFKTSNKKTCSLPPKFSQSKQANCCCFRTMRMWKTMLATTDRRIHMRKSVILQSLLYAGPGHDSWISACRSNRPTDTNQHQIHFIRDACWSCFERSWKLFQLGLLNSHLYYEHWQEICLWSNPLAEDTEVVVIA